VQGCCPGEHDARRALGGSGRRPARPGRAGRARAGAVQAAGGSWSECAKLMESRGCRTARVSRSRCSRPCRRSSATPSTGRGPAALAGQAGGRLCQPRGARADRRRDPLAAADAGRAVRHVERPRAAAHATGVRGRGLPGARSPTGRRAPDDRAARAPVGDGWEPDVDYPLPTRQELVAKIEAEFAAVGSDAGNVSERIAAWEAKHDDPKITIAPLPPLSTELEATADKIFGKASRRQRR
jgi:hypothetical protein